MKSDSRYVAGTALVLASILALTGCGGGGSGGSSGSGSERSGTTVMLSNSPLALEEDEGTLDEASSEARFFGWGKLRNRDILSLTVTITEIYFQYCDDRGPDAQLEVVLVHDHEFDPASVTIEEGGTVRWEWATGLEHTITNGSISDANAGSLFNETASGLGSTVELTFQAAGVYHYFSNRADDIDSAMMGSIFVKPESDNDHHGHHHDAAAAATPDRHGNNPGNGEGRVNVFEGEYDVSLLELTDISQILTIADIPPTDYCKIFIRIEDPRLVLKSNPNKVIRNVHLTSSGRISIKEHFEINILDETLILLDFGGVNVFRFGRNGPYLLAPRIRADVRVIGADVVINGEIFTLDSGERVIGVIDGDPFYSIFVGKKAKIFSDDDADDAGVDAAITTDLNFSDLALGQQVRILGNVDGDGGITAKTVEILDDSINTL